MTSLITFVIPIGRGHEQHARHAIASASIQPYSTVITVYDAEARGAGWARNQGLKDVTTPFVTFLDADDTLDPNFANETLELCNRTGRYVYTDYQRDGEVHPAPDCAWVGRTWHVVTTLLPTAWARAVGGFDETFGGLEDTEFYIKLNVQGYCGVRLPKPLVHYTRNGFRALALEHNQEYKTVLLNEISRRYGGYAMACCGQQETRIALPQGARLEGDVLAMPTWGGNREEIGRISGRLYPRASRGKVIWLDPRDQQAAPHMWALVDLPKPTENAHVREIIAAAQAHTQPRGIELLVQEMRKAEPHIYRKPIPAGGSYHPDVHGLLAKV